ncbi:MAG: aldehyde dehydrogenase family protein, partial [Chitinophagales bacterium]
YKGSEFTPLTSMNLFSALKEAGIPDGVANLVNGDAAKIGEAMLHHPSLKKISFTGSTRVGKILMDGASRTGTKLALELGGNAPVIIMDDVDVEKVAKSAASGRFRNAGQVCNIPQRFYVQRKIYDQFLAAVSKYVSQLKVGNGLEAETRMGPLINKRQQQQVMSVIEEAKGEGAQITIGGIASKKGFFISPAVIADRNSSAKFYDKEIFGPVLPIIPFDTKEEVIEKANNTLYGLAAYVWTNNLQDAIWLYERLEFGMIGVNDWAPQGTEAPFGGWKQSGIGHEAGMEGMQEYMEKKLVTIGGL